MTKKNEEMTLPHEAHEVNMAINSAIHTISTMERARKKHAYGTWMQEGMVWHLSRVIGHATRAMTEILARSAPKHIKRDPYYDDGETQESHVSNANTRSAMAAYTLWTPRVYLSGKITGVEDFGASEFQKAEDLAKEKWPHFTIVNPTKHYEGRTDLPRYIYMKRDFMEVLAATHIVFLESAKDSQGALKEALVAGETGVDLYEMRDGQIVPVAMTDVDIKENE